MTDQERILQFLKMIGPTIPSKVAKNIKTEILLASAHLSDLAAQGKVKISKLKIGGSPLYYLPGQEDQLYNFAAGNINPKDFKVLERLKNEQVLQENKLDLLSKVALRSLNDFATPLHVTFEERTELFWKWHLLSVEQTNQILSALLGSREQAKNEELAIPESESPRITVPEPEIIVPEINPPSFQGKPITELERALLEKEEHQQKLPVETAPRTETRKRGRPRTQEPDNFLSQAEQFLQGLEIVVETKEVLRRNAELNLMVKVPSVVGVMKYFCKAKQKKRCDEKDLSSAYMEAQMKKLPLLFLYTQELSKKAQEMLEANAFENIVVKRI